MKRLQNLFGCTRTWLAGLLYYVEIHRQSCRRIETWLQPFFAFVEPSVRAGEKNMNTQNKLPILILGIDHYRSLPLNEQYAHFCALGYPDEFEERYEAALGDFPKLIAIEGVDRVGISWTAVELLIGTKEIVAEDNKGMFRILGHYILHFTHDGYYVENVDRTLGSVTKYAHPHVRQGEQFCMGAGHAAAKTGIKDGLYSVPLGIFMTALYLKKDTVIIGGPYQGAELENWPERK